MSKSLKKPLKAKPTVLVVGPKSPPIGGMSMQTAMLLQWLKHESINVEYIPSNACLTPKVLNQIRGVRGLIRLCVMSLRLLKKCRQADIIHLMANSGGSWYAVARPVLKIAKLFNVPVVVNYRGGGAKDFFSGHMPKIRAELESAAAIVVPSQFLANIFQSYGFATHIIPNAVDLAKFKPTQAHPESYCFIARNLEAIYGNDMAIQALAIVRKSYPEMRLVIAGEGEKRAELEQLVQSLHLQDAVHFTGKLSHEQMAQYYAKALLLINPSRVDNMPNALIEAQASGTPILSTRVGGIPHMVQHLQTAYLVDEPTVEALATGWLDLLNQSALQQQIRTQALLQVQSLSWPHMIRNWLEMYRKLGVNIAS